MTESLDTLLVTLTGYKSGRRNSAADVKRLQQIQSIIADLLASETAEDTSDSETAEPADMPMTGKAISKRPDVNPKAGVAAYGDVTFADEKNKKYPIDTEEHIRSAWNYINHPDNAGKYAPDEIAQIKHKIVAAWKDKIDPAGPPSAKTASAMGASGLDLSYAKSLGLAFPDDALASLLAVKRITSSVIGGYLTLNGDPDHTDVEREFFDARTDHWMDKISLPIPLTYDHAQDAKTADAPVIGQITDWGRDDTGVWYAAQLDRAHAYRKALDGLIERGAIGTSSDSAPQYITRQKSKSGATYLARWPLFAAALTPTPAEPRQFETVDYFKSIGAHLPTAPDGSGFDPDRSAFEKARREADLFQLYL